MGALMGHVAPGIGFFGIGLWHLISHTKLHALHPNSYKSMPWFPTPKLKYLELYAIMLGSTLSISVELFISPTKHQPLDQDGTIPSSHLHNFEHSLISTTFLVYAAFAILLDRTKAQQQNGLTHFLASIAFGQQLLLFHLHSSDHLGVEGQYHLLLQVIILVSLTTTLMGIGLTKSFLVSFVRSLSIMFQGVWFMVMGFMLWTPSLIPKGCFMNLEDANYVVRCTKDEALHRAKSLVNIEFSYYLIGVTIFGVSLYLFTVKKYCSLTKEEVADEDQGENDVESQMKIKLIGESKSFIHMGKDFATIDHMER